MADGMYRVGLVGATSLVGKELADELLDSLLATSSFVLLDDEEATGQVAAVGDEPAVVERIEPGSFERMDFAFFCGDTALTEAHWQAARRQGASIVDMSYALEQEAGVLVRAAHIPAALLGSGKAGAASPRPNLATPAVVAAHPAAVMLGLVAARLAAKMKVAHLAATLVEPASQHGREAMDELHQQTVNLLSFQNLPREQYDAQVAFNVLPALGTAARVKLTETASRISRHYRLIGASLPTLNLELIQAPVFHGYVASVLLEVEEATTVYEIERALEGESIDVVTDDSDPPTNLSAAGQEDVMVRVRSVSEAAAPNSLSTRFWLWIAADNLKLNALNAIACANELKRLRPGATVQ
jgi:aspartate-semialdehyde dehydrogenase